MQSTKIFETNTTDHILISLASEMGINDYQATSLSQKKEIAKAAISKYVDGQISLDDLSEIGNIFYGLMTENEMAKGEDDYFLAMGDLAYHERNFVVNPDMKNYFLACCKEVFGGKSSTKQTKAVVIDL